VTFSHWLWLALLVYKSVQHPAALKHFVDDDDDDDDNDNKKQK